MSRPRLGWLAAAPLLLSGRSVANQPRAEVQEVKVMELSNRPLRVGKVSADPVMSMELMSKPLQYQKVTVSIEAPLDLLIAQPQIQKIGLEGLTYTPPKPSDEGDDVADKMVQAAGKNADEKTQQRAAELASTVATQQARADGLSDEQAAAAGQAAEDRVRKDYAPDAGTPAAAPAPAAAPKPAGPDVLEAPPTDDQGSDPGVVNVPAAGAPSN